jgi:predicted nucleic acid-binding protein
VLNGRLDAGRAEEAVEDLVDWGLERIPHRRLLRGVWGLRGHISAYDALYVEAARQRGVALLTADGPLARARGLGITIHNVRVS